MTNNVRNLFQSPFGSGKTKNSIIVKANRFLSQALFFLSYMALTNVTTQGVKRHGYTFTAVAINEMGLLSGLIARLAPTSASA